LASGGCTRGASPQSVDLDELNPEQEEQEDQDDDDDQGEASTEIGPESEEENGADDDDDDDEPSGDSQTDSLPEDQKFDLAQFPDLPSDEVRCPIDFLFVVDNSGSMADEQANLAASFPSFIQGIRDTVETDDFRVLVVDSDSSSMHSWMCSEGDCECIGTPANSDVCCVQVCTDPANKTCADKPCADFPPGTDSDCNLALGAGRIADGNGVSCQFEGDRRYLLGDATQLEASFACAASVGTQGAGKERMALAMNTAISPPVVGADGCNEGFLRDNTLLAVVLITDEEEKLGEGSPGTPKEWYDTLIATKGGNADHVVMIGFIGDTGLPGAICQPFDDDKETGAEESPRLHEFIDHFGDRGLAASVCAPDYGPAFTDAIAKIDTACDALFPK
jgi:hypothetical protein